MKYILTIALAIVLVSNASAQNANVKVVRAVRNMPVSEESNLQIMLDKLQQESENTVVYPLMQMTRAAFTKVQSMKKHGRHERIRSNNGKRTINPNRV